MKTCKQCKWFHVTVVDDGDFEQCFIDPEVADRFPDNPACSRFEPIEKAAQDEKTLFVALQRGDVNAVQTHIKAILRAAGYSYQELSVTEPKEPA